MYRINDLWLAVLFAVIGWFCTGIQADSYAQPIPTAPPQSVTVCSGLCIYLEAYETEGAVRYQWNPEDDGISYEPEPTDRRKVKLCAENGFRPPSSYTWTAYNASDQAIGQGVVNVTTIVVEAAISPSGTITIQQGQSQDLTVIPHTDPQWTYQWIKTDENNMSLPIQGATSHTYSVTSAGYYYVSISHPLCSLTYVPEGVKVIVEEPSCDFKFEGYPNMCEGSSSDIYIRPAIFNPNQVFQWAPTDYLDFLGNNNGQHVKITLPRLIPGPLPQTKTYTVTTEQDGCTKSKKVVVHLVEKEEIFKIYEKYDYETGIFTPFRKEICKDDEPFPFMVDPCCIGDIVTWNPDVPGLIVRDPNGISDRNYLFDPSKITNTTNVTIHYSDEEFIGCTNVTEATVEILVKTDCGDDPCRKIKDVVKIEGVNERTECVEPEPESCDAKYKDWPRVRFLLPATFPSFEGVEHCDEMYVSLPFDASLDVHAGFDMGMAYTPDNGTGTLAERIATRLGNIEVPSLAYCAQRETLTVYYDPFMYSELCASRCGCSPSASHLRIMINICGCNILSEASPVFCGRCCEEFCDPKGGPGCDDPPCGEKVSADCLNAIPPRSECPQKQKVFGTVQFQGKADCRVGYTFYSPVLAKILNNNSIANLLLRDGCNPPNCSLRINEFDPPNVNTCCTTQVLPTTNLACQIPDINGNPVPLSESQIISNILVTYARYGSITVSDPNHPDNHDYDLILQLAYNPTSPRELRYVLKWNKVHPFCSQNDKMLGAILKFQITRENQTFNFLENSEMPHECCSPEKDLLYGLDPKEHCLCCD